MDEFYLKILSGNHLGAEIPLESGQHSLGRGSECDLVFTDASLGETEVIIELSMEGAIRVTHQDGGILYLNGTPQGSQIIPQPFDIITSGQLYFALGPAEANWPELILPTLQHPEPDEDNGEEQKENENENNDQGELPDVPDDILDDDTDPLDLELDDDTPGEADTESEENDDEFDHPLANIDKRWLLVIPLLFSTLLLLIIFTSSSDEPKREEVVQSRSYLDQSREIISLMQLKNIETKELNDNSLLMSGYVKTMDDKQKLLNALNERGIPFMPQVVVLDEMRTHAETVLKTLGYRSLAVELDTSPGSLVLTGYVRSPEVLPNITERLKQEIHGLVDITEQVEHQANRVTYLKRMLQEKRLGTRINLTQKPGLVTLEGHLLDDEQVYNLNEVITRFRKRYGNNPALRVAAKSGSSLTRGSVKKSSDLGIRAVSMGQVPYVIMADGAKYLLGAKLENGYTLEDINLDYILLIKGTNQIKYPLGGNRGTQ